MSWPDIEYNRMLMDDPSADNVMADVGLAIACGIRATLQTGVNAHRALGRIVGYCEGEMLIVRVAAGAMFDDFRVNRPTLIMRFAAAGRIYRFRTSVLGTLDEPALVVSSWPNKVSAVRQRVHERVPCRLQARLHHAGRGDDVTMTDLSPGGCRVAMGPGAAADGWLTIDSSVDIEFQASLCGTQRLAARVKSLKGPHPIAGLMFEHVDQNQQVAIDQLIDSIRAVW